ncbi:FUSC family protein [Litchfieldella xinjiangensis]|uniref:FUSC family protein n=1 Tax=Litchfieldella xinjiangensis TaxID=1166948 RepID=UPI0006945F16|nr:FUSC family protein [Halomonas xinjiangensis]
MILPRLRDPYFNYRYRHVLHVVRVSLALAITYGIIHVFPIPHSGWALVSTIMVMGNLPHIGGVLDKAKQRLLGTLAGAAWGVVLILIPLPLPGLIPLGALLGIAAATYITFANRHGYAGLMFGISLLLVLGEDNRELSVALWRSFDVILGTLVGIAATILILPQKATDMLRFLLADNLDKMARLYRAHTTSSSGDDIDARELLKATSALLIKQRGLVDAIHSERRLKRGEMDDLLSLQRRMLSTIELLLETHWTTLAGHDRIEALEGLRDQQHRLARSLGTLAFQIRTGHPIDVEIAPFDLQRYAGKIEGARAEDGRVLFSPGGYLWLNRELARLTESLVERLGSLRRLPSKRLRRRAPHHKLVDTAALPDSGSNSHDKASDHDNQRS